VDLGLTGKTALVIGASGGVGAETARVLSREGVRLALVARRKGELDALTSQLGKAGTEVLALGADAGVPGACEAIVEKALARFGALHRLVVIAGPIGTRGTLLETCDEDWMWYFQQCLMITVRACRAALAPLLEHPDSAIVLTSAYSIRSQKAELVAYTAMKTAIASLTKNLAKTYGPRGLRVNCIAPGIIVRDTAVPDGPVQRDGEADPETARYEQVRRKFGMVVALGRAGRHEEFADMVAFLISARASYVTGAIINIDGGTDF
jgi:3-oxoacyl-[acyl-carrier protein] reductase